MYVTMRLHGQSSSCVIELSFFFGSCAKNRMGYYHIGFHRFRVHSLVFVGYIHNDIPEVVVSYKNFGVISKTKDIWSKA